MSGTTSGKTKATVCVIVPVYNAEKTIKKSLKSIFRQSYRGILIVAVDDGSTDRSPEIIAEMAKKDSRLIPVRQSNAGSISARKTGVRYALENGIPFICFCDADDRLPRTSVERMVSAMLKSEADLVCGNIKKRWRSIAIPGTFKPECLRIGAPVIYSKEEIRDKLIVSYFGVSNFPVSFAAKLYRTSAIEFFLNDAPLVRFYGEDLSVTLKIMLTVDRLCIIPDTVYYYQTGGATGRWMPTMLEDFYSLYRYRQVVIESHCLKKDCSDFMAAEAMNFLRTFFSRILEHKKELQKDRQRFLEIIEKTISEPLFRDAATMVTERGWNNRMAPLVNSGSADEIAEWIEKYNNSIRNSIKGRVRGILNKLA